MRQTIVGEQENEADRGQRQRWQINGVGIGGESLDPAKEFGGQVVDLQPEKILYLGEKNHHGNTVGETDDDGHRDEADQLPHARQPHRQQKHAGQHGGAHQVGKAVNGDNAVNDGYEGAGWAADLYARPAKKRGNQAGDDRCPDTGSRRATRGNREGHGQGQGENPNRYPRGEIFAELCFVVGGQAIQQLGVKGDFHGAGSGAKRIII